MGSCCKALLNKVLGSFEAVAGCCACSCSGNVFAVMDVHGAENDVTNLSSDMGLRLTFSQSLPAFGSYEPPDGCGGLLETGSSWAMATLAWVTGVDPHAGGVVLLPSPRCACSCSLLAWAGIRCCFSSRAVLEAIECFQLLIPYLYCPVVDFRLMLAVTTFSPSLSPQLSFVKIIYLQSILSDSVTSFQNQHLWYCSSDSELSVSMGRWLACFS